jgi:hypothetical protein
MPDGQKLVPYRVRKYGLRSQTRMSYISSRIALKENGFVLDERHKNCIFPSTGSESVKHWIIKCLVFKILRDRGRQVGTEVEIKNAIVDVLDTTSIIAYEIETALTRQRILEKLRNFVSVRDVFFIDTREVPDDIFEAEKYLRDKMV